ncbi:FAD-dependent oxidoreductase [Streptomyces sp. AM6-12]|uniref:FAD-dependent oxidoreductase n=1 Tax=Streptomyces sp. AM6-12 TaxID=3345149 RepID=UPI003796F7E7
MLAADDVVGGRMRTDRLDGFTVVRGFHVVNNPACPQLRRRLPARFVGPRPFLPGVLVHRGDQRVLPDDPRRHPDAVASLPAGRLARPRDLLAPAVLGTRDALAPARTLKHAPECTAGTALTDAGFSEPFIRGLLPAVRGSSSQGSSWRTRWRRFRTPWPPPFQRAPYGTPVRAAWQRPDRRVMLLSLS